jgi:hypothetical protein
MRTLTKIATVGSLLVFGGIVFAQQSEWQDKIQEDLNGYKDRIVESCGASDKLTLKFEGKLACNPRENCGKEYGSVSTLCTSGTDAVNDVCLNNKALKKAMSKVTSISCTLGKGTLSYKLAGGKLTFMVDTKVENNAAGQEADLVAKLKKDLDK